MNFSAFPAKSPVKGTVFPGASGKTGSLSKPSPMSSASKAAQRKTQDDFVKSLQQQIYLLELETRFLRSNKSLSEKEATEDVTALKRQFQDRLSAADAATAAATASAASESARARDLETELAQVRDDLAESHRRLLRATAEWESQVAAKHAEVSRLTSAAARAKQTVETLQAATAAAQAECVRLKSDVAAATAREEKWRSLHDEAQAVVTDLRVRAESHAGVQLALEAAQTAARDAEAARAKAAAQLRHVELALAHEAEVRRRCEAEMQELLGEHARVGGRLAAAEAELARVSRDAEVRVAAKVEETETLHRRVRDLTAELVAAKAVVEQKDRALAQAHDAMHTRELAAMRLHDELGQERDRGEAEAAAAAGMRGEVTEARHEAAAMRAQVAKVEAELAAVRKQLADEAEAHAAVRARLAEWERRGAVYAKMEAVMQGLPVEPIQDLRRALGSLSTS
ncbi:hypothetical protein H9P43_009163 [Blastocladiella emersonii ATCC 22665]|nr:hypothetical protein H9P43_009163 [Blastocladiella emersonii ATCC 22665]